MIVALENIYFQQILKTKTNTLLETVRGAHGFNEILLKPCPHTQITNVK